MGMCRESAHDEIGRPRRHGLQRHVTARDDLGFRVGDALERVLDQAGDILFVLDD